MIDSQERRGTEKKESFFSKQLKKINSFKYGFAASSIASLLLAVAVGKGLMSFTNIGPISLSSGGNGSVIEPSEVNTNSSETNNGSLVVSGGDESIQSIAPTAEDSQETVQNVGGEQTIQEDSNNTEQLQGSDIGGAVAGRDVNVTITYANNGELPGFDVGNKGYNAEPPDIGKFNDAVLVSDVSFGEKFFDSETRDVFIQGKKYKTTFHLESYSDEQRRVAFSLAESSMKPKGALFQFGLGDWSSGSTTLTYLVKISADGEPLWSGQVKYSERQIASVVLDVVGYSDIIFEYQVVELGGADPRKNPLFFTEAKLLFD